MIQNFIDKYQPIRIQHQISSLMHSTFYKVESLEQLYDKFVNAETNLFNELHSIMLLDKSKTDIQTLILNLN
jgi:hypothetical protein